MPRLLECSWRRFHRVHSHLPNGAIYKVIREVDGSDRFSYISAGIERLMEVSAEDALKDSSLLYRQFIPEDAALLLAAIKKSRRNLSVLDIQLRIQTPRASGTYGSTIYTEAIGHAEFNADGKVIRLYGTAQDVTERQVALNERKQAEEELRRSETLLATAQKVAHMGSWEWYLESQKQIWSAETFRIFGLNPTQSAPTQAAFLQMLHPEDRPVLQRHLLQAIANLLKARKFIQELQKMGCRFALDDFGVGMSSFAYLKSLPVDYLKIDGSFIRNIVDNPVDNAIVTAITQIGSVMGIQTIAEFVENDAILKRITALGIDYAQGYGIAVPCPLS
ncbi:sensor domain-containing phosphodiesterase [Nostoc sp.]|uniref:sensor domain-containing phosphodiesterase n=1 Tax=Nostoc sp. TaxID=1180 RepID=UPI003FA53C65